MTTNHKPMTAAQKASQKKARKSQKALAAALWAAGDDAIDLATAAKRVCMANEKGEPKTVVRHAERALRGEHEDMLSGMALADLSGRAAGHVLRARDKLDLTLGDGCEFTAAAYWKWRAEGGEWNTVETMLKKRVDELKAASR